MLSLAGLSTQASAFDHIYKSLQVYVEPEVLVRKETGQLVSITNQGSIQANASSNVQGWGVKRITLCAGQGNYGATTFGCRSKTFDYKKDHGFPQWVSGYPGVYYIVQASPQLFANKCFSTVEIPDALYLTVELGDYVAPAITPAPPPDAGSRYPLMVKVMCAGDRPDLDRLGAPGQLPPSGADPNPPPAPGSEGNPVPSLPGKLAPGSSGHGRKLNQ